MRALATSFVPMAVEAESETTEDAVLGGRLLLRQPQRGHRVGHDAILLAAATDARAGRSTPSTSARASAPPGLRSRGALPACTSRWSRSIRALAALARDNAERNGLADRVRVAALDVAAGAQQFAAAGHRAGRGRTRPDESAVQRPGAAESLAGRRAPPRACGVPDDTLVAMDQARGTGCLRRPAR